MKCFYQALASMLFVFAFPASAQSIREMKGKRVIMLPPVEEKVQESVYTKESLAKYNFADKFASASR